MEEHIYSEINSHEHNHWWFVSRRKIIEAILLSFSNKNPSQHVLEIGCGSGGNLDLLAKFGSLYAIELNEAARINAIKKNICPIKKGFLPNNIPFDFDFDIICLFDVLEHIDDDYTSLINIKNKLKPNGKVCITVPAYNFLWSAHDDANHHKRRYYKKNLIKLLEKSGFKIIYSSYFNTFLFPSILIARFFQNIFRIKSTTEYDISSPLNSIFLKIFSSESLFLPKASFPFGVSIIVVAQNSTQVSY
jgi:SAM-dependent methyltransferase